MMSTLYAASVEVLTEIVGPVPAELCIYSASMELGKDAEELGADDYDAIAAKICADLGRFASPALIDLALEEIAARIDRPSGGCGCGSCSCDGDGT